MYQDILYRPLSSRFSLAFRYAVFDTGGHNSRIYAHEHDVLYAFSFPFYAQKGRRFYLLARYRFRQGELAVRFARSFFLNLDQTGSGQDASQGPARTEIKAQLRLRR